MNSFNINRFGRTLYWVLSVNFRTLLLWTIGSALAVFVGEMFFMHFMSTTATPYVMIRESSAICTILFTIASLVLISSIVTSVNNKRKREAFLMLPSSNLEKFLSLVAYTTVISIACIFLAIVMGDSLRMLWLWASGYSNEMMGTTIPTAHNGETYYWYSSAVPLVVNNLTPHNISNGDSYLIDDGKCKILYMVTNGYTIAKYVLTVAFVVWLHSLFTLGGTLLRKYAFVVSGIVFFFILWLYAWAEHHGFNIYDRQYYQEFGREGFDQFETVVLMVNTSVASVVLLLSTAFSIFNYWASFHIFKSFQLITNKWTNYDILKR